MKLLAQAPGRVNLIGDHTDYADGLVLPMAIDLGTTIEMEPGVPWIELISDADEEPVFLDLDHLIEPSQVLPSWARYIAAVAYMMRPEVGGRGFVRSTLPIGAGLSSSASLTLATALALGFEGNPLELALICQQAEHLATGVPCGIMDQLASASGVHGCALLIDCRSHEVRPVPVPEGAQIVVIDSGIHRTLASSNYGVRKAQADEAAALIGNLRDVTIRDVEMIAHDDLRRRARHIVTENERVLAAADALADGDLAAMGRLMNESHRSLREDYEVSTREMDELTSALRAIPGVHGSRMTGAGFGGCVIALTEPDVSLPADLGERSWVVAPSAGASVTRID
ncbi:MAG: galactokinase [Acidimicrobiales bacterium]